METAEALRREVAKVIVGQTDVIDHVIVAFLARGHVLLEGVPGTAKTLLVKTLAVILGREFRRVQLTPDLMPSDIVGTYAFDVRSGQFSLRKGPIFTSVLLADEINRAPAKTQSALLEGMQERQVTIDGVRHALAADFITFATQNPVEYEGTYPLPEAQLDRFMLKIVVDYPSADEEAVLLLKYHQGFDADRLDAVGLEQVATEETVAVCRQEIAGLTVDQSVLGYIAQVTRATRESPHLLLGCSPRASVMLLQAAKAFAAMLGRDYVNPDDVKAMSLPVLRHRVLLRPEADIEGLRADDILADVIEGIPVPR
jgi:MoxR-like ATPase